MTKDNRVPLRFTVEVEEILESGAIRRKYVPVIAGSEEEALAMVELMPNCTLRIVE